MLLNIIVKKTGPYTLTLFHHHLSEIITTLSLCFRLLFNLKNLHLDYETRFILIKNWTGRLFSIEWPYY